MSEKVSNKITYLYITMAFMILILHVVVISSFDESQILLTFNKVVRTICNMGVSTFFFLSAVLFYRSLDSRKYADVVIKKAKSLVVPYLVWSILATVIKYIKGDIPESPWQAVKDVLLATNNSVLWFVRVLFVFFLTYPLFKLILKNKKLFWLIWTIIFAINIYIGPTVGYGGVRYWLPVYMLGVYLGYYHKNKILNNDTRGYIQIIAAAVIFALMITAAYFNDYGIYICRVFSPLCILVIADVFLIEVRPKWWMRQSFYYYCSQLIVGSAVLKLYIYIFGSGLVSALAAHLIMPALVMAVLSVPLYIMKKWLPKTLSVLTGGR